MKKLSYILPLLLLKINCCWVALWNWHQLFFLSLFNVYLYFKADENASNISSNILNFRCWTKCWMHLRAYKIYKKRKKKTKIVLDDLRWNLFSIKFFSQHFLVHPTKCSCRMPLSTVSSTIWFFIIALSTKHMRLSVFRTFLLTFECQ